MIYTQKDLLITMHGCAKPADNKFLLKPVQKSVGDAKNLKDKDPKLASHVQTIVDGLNLFGWFLAVSTILTINRPFVIALNLRLPRGEY